MLEETIVKVLEPAFMLNTIGEKVATFTYKKTSFKANVQANDGQIQLRMYGLVEGQSLKVYTTHKLPVNIKACHLEIEGIEYKILSFDAYGSNHKKIVTEQVVK